MNEETPAVRERGKGKLFWKTQGECWRRAVLPFLVYFFLGLLTICCQSISIRALQIVLGSICILGGAALNALLLYRTGKEHYGFFVTGELRRRTEGPSSNKVKEHCEYRPWKGFLIGFFVGVPTVIFGLAALAGGWAELLIMFFAGWAAVPVVWIRFTVPELSIALSIVFIVIPIIVSGVFYTVGARVGKRKQEEAEARAEAVARLAREAEERRKIQREQTEEQRRKTLQSKKKKK